MMALEAMSCKSKISIWWDIEGCSVPPNMNPHSIAKNLSSALQRAQLMGPVEINAFGDNMMLDRITQKMLSDTGITLNHIPRGHKYAADKAILVAMLLWALDNSPPANILLISGDGDFSNALNRLRFKTYTILLACPQPGLVSPALFGAANKAWSWQDLARGQLTEIQASHMSHETSSSSSSTESTSVYLKKAKQAKRLKNTSVVVPGPVLENQKKGNILEGLDCVINPEMPCLSTTSNMGSTQSPSIVDTDQTQINSTRSISQDSNATEKRVIIPQQDLTVPVVHLNGVDDADRSQTSTTVGKFAGGMQETLPYEISLGKVYLAMSTLDNDMLAPTEVNLSDCIKYWDNEHNHVNVKQTIAKAVDLRHVMKMQLSQTLSMYLPPNSKEPWICVDPGNMKIVYPDDVWSELRDLLLKTQVQRFVLCSHSRYAAAQELKKLSISQIKRLAIAKIMNLLQQALVQRRWIKRQGASWSTMVVVNQNLQKPEQERIQKQNAQLNRQHLVNLQQKYGGPAGHEQANRDATLSKLKSLLPRILKGNDSYDISSLSRDFELITFEALDFVKLGFSSLHDLLTEVSDVVSVDHTESGKMLLRLVNQDSNFKNPAAKFKNPGKYKKPANFSNKVSKKASSRDEEASRQINVVMELKSWLAHIVDVVKDGYDIAKIQQDFFQATGKDLNIEGLPFDKLQLHLMQFRSVIRVDRSPEGVWMAYPVANHNASTGT